MYSYYQATAVVVVVATEEEAVADTAAAAAEVDTVVSFVVDTGHETSILASRKPENRG